MIQFGYRSVRNLLLTASLLGAPMPANAAEAPAQARFKAISDYLHQLVDTKRFPGANVLILKDGREVYYAEAGLKDVEANQPIRRDTIFRIYSMSKPVTTAAVMILVDEGKIKLSDPVTKYVPEFANLQVYKGMKDGVVQTEPARPMTVENLLTHTAGLTYGFQLTTPVAAMYQKTGLGGDRWRFDPAFAGGGRLAQTLASLPLAYQPGERFHYSMALDVAALVVQRASGVPFGEFLQNRIFGPLGMTDTGFDMPAAKGPRLASLYGPGPGGGLKVTDVGATSALLKPIPGFSGGGGLLSTVDDYAAFAEMLQEGGTLKGHRILSRSAVQAMMTNHLTPAQLVELKTTAGFGLGAQGTVWASAMAVQS
ncbi:MAG: serine hydrolase [Phenylobacterium zucineum]|nr:MAG: serine hydrolase [Phenylobacterium zucineum]